MDENSEEVTIQMNQPSKSGPSGSRSKQQSKSADEESEEDQEEDEEDNSSQEQERPAKKGKRRAGKEGSAEKGTQSEKDSSRDETDDDEEDDESGEKDEYGSEAEEDEDQVEEVEGTEEGDEDEDDDYGESEDEEGPGISEKYLQACLDGLKKQMIEEAKNISNKNAAIVFELRIKDLAKTVQTMKDQTLREAKDRISDLYIKLDNQNLGFVEQVQKLEVDTAEALKLLKSAHQKALHERSDLQTQFESFHEEIVDLQNQNYDLSKHISHMTKLQEITFK